MPTYVYRCKDCGHEFETIQKMSDDPLKTCPECEGAISRLLFPPGIVFKGSGFHVNDYPGSKTVSSTPAASETPSTPAPAAEEKKTESVATKS